MTTVKLDIELDSEVYPELHATLSALRSPRARAERMRQLAAAGLVWEKVRLHGAAAVAAPAVDDAPSSFVTRPDVAPVPTAVAEPLPPIERRAATRRSRAVPAEPRRDTGFVDLAINAEPTPVPPAATARRAARPSRKDVEQVIRELPVLVDVVEDVAPLPEPEDDTRDTDVADAAGWASMNAYPDDVAPPSHEQDDTAELPEAALHVTALSHKPETRSRLMRMKERGLFKNG